MTKEISIFSYNSRTNKTLPHSPRREDIIWQLFLRGKLKYRPYWDQGEKLKVFTTQLKKGQQINKTIKLIRKA